MPEQVVVVLTVLLAVLVALGVLPVVAGAMQYLLIPAHAWINHYGRAAPHLPRVAVVVPAWNEGAVIGRSIDRLLSLEYPPDALRVYVVDDASTDDTPDVVRAKAVQYPGRVVHLRREQGGQGKAHTLNHGIEQVLADDWMQALLIMDADVIYRPDSLRRMSRHLADPRVGAVTAYIREGSPEPRYLTRFIGYEYIAAQACARRAQNVLGAMACLAGGAQLHSRENLVAVGGRIDTSSLAEDTFTTFRTQLGGQRVVFEPNAVVLAEEPGSIDALWKQRLRWARGNVQITRAFRRLWFRPAPRFPQDHPDVELRGQPMHGLGGAAFGLIWFTLLLMPAFMVMVAVGLVGLYLLDIAVPGPDVALRTFQALWFAAGGAYVLITLLTVLVDPQTGRRCWREALTFPGLWSLAVMAAAFAPDLVLVRLPQLLGYTLTPLGVHLVMLTLYASVALTMVGAWLARRLELTRWGRPLTPALVYLVGYGPLLCAITFDSYVKEWRGAAQVWDKTEKTGRVLG